MFLDLYKILEVSPSATPDKIKRAFRVSALKYHPDRTFNNKALEDKFREVKLAYDTLTNERQRKVYDLTYIAHYRQYHQKDHTAHTHTATKARVTPQAYLKALRQLKKSTEKPGWHRADQYALLTAINKFLPDRVIQSLKAHDDLSLNREVNILVLQCSKKLNKANTLIIKAKLIRLAGTDNEALKQIYQFTESDLTICYKNIRNNISNALAGILNPIKNLASVKNLFKMKRGMGW